MTVEYDSRDSCCPIGLPRFPCSLRSNCGAYSGREPTKVEVLEAELDELQRVGCQPFGDVEALRRFSHYITYDLSVLDKPVNI